MNFRSTFTSLNISSTGLSAQRQKLEAISSNIANVNTTRTENGEPYRRRISLMEVDKVPAFDRILQDKKLQLKTAHRAHFPFSDRSRILTNNHPGVQTEVLADQSDFREVYDPSHPDANEQGYVRMPNVNIVAEMVDMINASRAYEANLSSIEAAKSMAKEALDI